MYNSMAGLCALLFPIPHERGKFMKRILSLLLILALTMSSTAAFALTGAEALGIANSSGSGYSGNYPVLRVGSRDGTDSAARQRIIDRGVCEAHTVNTQQSADGAPVVCQLSAAGHKRQQLIPGFQTIQFRRIGI